jgi:hypothetical protein
MGSQLERVVVTWLKERPEMLQNDAALLIFIALRGEKK